MDDTATNVLIVDDDADLREMLEATIALAGTFHCVPADSLADLQEHPEALACSVAILDVNLGVGQPSGVDVCHWLRQHGFTGRVVFLTGHAANDPRVRAAAAVANSSILNKPISFHVLADLVKSP